MDERWVVRWDDRWLRQTADWYKGSVETIDEAGKWTTEEAARERLSEANWQWQQSAKVERIDVPEPAKVDVEALLREVDRRNAGGAYTNHPAHEDVREWTNGRIAIELAAALRTEQGAHEFTVCEFKDLLGKHHDLRRHLQAVVALFREDSAAVEVVAARAFLAGEEQAPRHDDRQEIELLRKELADKGAALTRLQETRFEVEKARDEIAQKREDAIRKSWSEEMSVANAKLREEREARTKTKRERDDAQEIIRVLRLRIDGVADVLWKDLPRE